MGLAGHRTRTTGSLTGEMAIARNAIALLTIVMLSVAAVLIMQQDTTEVVQEESFLPLVRPDDLAELHPSHDAEKFMDDESFWNIVHHDMQNPKLTAMMLKTHIASKTRKGGVSATK